MSKSAHTNMSVARSLVDLYEGQGDFSLPRNLSMREAFPIL